MLEAVKKIDADEELYLKMINEPPVKEYLNPDAFENFLVYIIEQDYKKAFRRPDSMYTRAKAESIQRHAFYEKHIHTILKRASNQLKRIQSGTMLSRRRTR